MTRKRVKQKGRVNLMAIDAKISLMNQIEKRFADVLTANDMGNVLQIVADIMEGFDIRERLVDMDTNDDLLDSFLSALTVQGRSAKTIERYRYIITRMMETVKVSTRRITVYHLRNYLAAEKARGIADSTLEGTRQVFSSYFNWLQRESLIDRNPVANLGAIKCPKKEKKTFSEVDLEKLKRNCECVRDMAIVSFLASSGCRISEVTGLNRDSVDLERLECVVHGKGDKERTVFIDAVTAMLLRQYLSERKDAEPELFKGKRGRLLPGGVRVMLKELEKRSGVDHVVHPHKFRRTYATNMARRGMPLQEIANLMGHEKIETTMRYVVLNRDDIKHDYRKYA